MRSLQAGDDYLMFPARYDSCCLLINGLHEEPALAAAGVKAVKTSSDDFVLRLESARKMHRRTPSTSTASSSSLNTEGMVDWWEERSPWAWQWAGVNNCCK